METLTKVNNFLGRYDKQLGLAMHVLFVIALIRGDVEGMVSSGIIATWFRIDNLKEQINGRTNSVQQHSR